MRSGDDRPASGQSATKPVDRDGLCGILAWIDEAKEAIAELRSIKEKGNG